MTTSNEVGTPTVLPHRRTVLLGGAAAAAAAAVARPADAATSAPPVATPAAVSVRPAGLTPIDARDVLVTPAGEVIDDDLEAALYALDRRTAEAQPIDDLQVALTLNDDFMGNTTASGSIGELGWAISAGSNPSGVTIALTTWAPGIVRLRTGTTSTGRTGINLGSAPLSACPVFVQETRLRLESLNDGSSGATVYLGLASEPPAGQEPASGCYFKYSAADGPNWQAVWANNDVRASADTAVLGGAKGVADTAWHRFRVTCDGGELTTSGNGLLGPGVTRFYVDDMLVAEIAGELLSSTAPPATYGPHIQIRNTSGAADRGLLVDYYDLRWEVAR